MRMINFIVGFLLLAATEQSCYAENADSIRINILEHELKNETLARENLRSEVEHLKSIAEKQAAVIDSLCNETETNSQNIKTTADDLGVKIEDANNCLKTKAEATDVQSKTLWGGILFILFVIIVCVVFYLTYRRINKGTTSIDEVRKAQNALKEAQTKMQGESIKLDNQLLELLDKQLKVINDNKTDSQTVQAEPDHSLVIKLANEIAKIETNLSKMDKSVRGYKQLVQAKDRMINNVIAYGYEIITLIGQEYNEGMQFPARFVPDESLEEGKRIITGMVKMQVNYNGRMIQAAEIVVNQNI